MVLKKIQSQTMMGIEFQEWDLFTVMMRVWLCFQFLQSSYYQNPWVFLASLSWGRGDTSTENQSIDTHVILHPGDGETHLPTIRAIRDETCSISEV